MKQTTTTARMIAFTIIWHEGTAEFNGKTFTDWKTVQYAFNRIYNNHGNDIGYTKVKVNVKWENGVEITDRIDVGNSGGDYSAKRETVGQYLSRQNSAMYGSNLSQGNRAALSFSDENSPKTTKKGVKISRNAPIMPPTIETPPNSPKQAVKRPKCSRLTFQQVIEMQAETFLLN